jgi:predicted RNA-binding protein YlxR (DUF448 family)
VVLSDGRSNRGRSAYVCPTAICFEKALASRALQRSLARNGSIRCAPADLRESMEHLLIGEEGL